MSNARILLVEDNADNLELVKFLLERAGYDVITAANGQAGLEIAARELPDLVLMDLSLPQMDGWTAARALRSNPLTAGIPLIALTAHTLPRDRKNAMDSGFDEFLSKPLNVQTFHETVKRVMQKDRRLPNN